jgi:hypothetical protein
VTGRLRDWTGTQRAGLWVVGICMVTAALVVLRLERTAGRPAEDQADA